MKSIIFATILSVLVALNLNAQFKGSIQITQEDGRKTYRQNGNHLTHKQLCEILRSNTESIKECNKSVCIDATAGFFIIPGFLSLIAGVGCSSLSLIAYVSHHDDQAIIYRNCAGIGLLAGPGLIIIGSKIAGKSQPHLIKSINNYNNTSITPRSEIITLGVGLTGDGVGLRLIF
jgi:hypothetical protein